MTGRHMVLSPPKFLPPDIMNDASFFSICPGALQAYPAGGAGSSERRDYVWNELPAPMPVIPPRETWRLWLAEEPAEEAALKKLLARYPAERILALYRLDLVGPPWPVVACSLTRPLSLTRWGPFFTAAPRSRLNPPPVSQERTSVSGRGRRVVARSTCAKRGRRGRWQPCR